MRQAAAKQRELTMRLSPHKLSSKFLQDELRNSKANGKTARNLSHYDALKQEHHMSTGRRRFGGSCLENMDNGRGLFDVRTHFLGLFSAVTLKKLIQIKTAFLCVL